MRILMIAAASSVHTIRWANGFAARGHEVHLASQHEAGAMLCSKVMLHPLPHRAGLGYMLNRAAIARLVERVEPDVVNAHYASGYGSLATAVEHVPVVLNVWGSDVFEFPAKSFLHRRLLSRNLQAADHLVSTSAFMATRIRSMFAGLPPITVIPFGVDPEIFIPSSEARAEGPVTIGTVKTLAPKYGIDTLIKAFAETSRDLGPGQVRLRIVGSGPQEQELRQLAERAGVAEQVEMVGAVPHDQVVAQLHQMDIFAALSRADSETFGVAVVEAAACGLPVVVSDAGGLPEVVLNGVTGAIVPREDAKAAAKEIKALVKDGDRRKRMGMKGREHVMRHFNWERDLDRMLELLGNVRVRSTRA